MKTTSRIAATLIGSLMLTAAFAATTDISTTPLETGQSSVVKPNVMILFDDSGSMAWDYMPDWLSGIFATAGVSKPYSGGGGGGTSTIGEQGDPYYYAAQFNGIYYNPNVYYQPGVTYAGAQMTSYGASACGGTNYSQVPVNGYANSPCSGGSGTINLVTGFPELTFCGPVPGSVTSIRVRSGGSGYLLPPTVTISAPTGGGTLVTATAVAVISGGAVTSITIVNGGSGYIAAPTVTISAPPAGSGHTTAAATASTNGGGAPGSYSASYCKRNWFDTSPAQTPFLYNTGAATNGYPDTSETFGSGNTVTVNLGSYPYPVVLTGNPFYYVIQPAEYCADAQLVNCVLSRVPTTVGATTYSYSAPVRYCVLASDQNSLSAVSGNTVFTTGGASSPRCQKKYNLALGYTLPRYGYFQRNDIVSTTLLYTRTTARIDCALTPVCTYAEEMQNFANWYAYYHTRILMAQTAVGLAFNTITSNYRIGFLTINAYAGGGSLSSSKFVAMGDFNATQRQSFYTTLYSLTPNNSTPLREALSRVGWYYAGKTTGLDAGMITNNNPDPVQYSCQQNFTILTTDGYWNGNAGQDLNGNSMEYNSLPYGNQDNDSTQIYSQRGPSAYGPGGYYDGNLADNTTGSGSGGGGGSRGGGGGSTYTSKGTLADVAMYYYKTDLRPAGSTNFNTGIDVSTDNVPTVPGVDQNPAQHMVTFTVGLGVDGYLTYDPVGQTYGSPDFLSIVNGTVGACVWAPGLTCNWPQVPAGTGFGDDPSKDDDLWHAAVNGRGAYLTAKNPQSLLRGLRSDLALIKAQVGAAAASATSTPNITLTDNAIYSTTFRTQYWDGEMVEQNINASTGIVNPTVVWSAQSLLDGAVAASSDSRTIYTLSAGALTAFNYANLDTVAQNWFNNTCALLSQCVGMIPADQAIVNSGTNLINYLRGQNQYGDSIHFRTRAHALGDLVDSRPAVVRDPRRHYSDAPIPPGNQSYATFAANNASRQSVVYVGGNDGMLHAFSGTTGSEMWAYIPRFQLSRLYNLADINYAVQHQFFVDGSPEVSDVLSTGDGTWHTILVVGMNDGGRGYVAFDVTNPSSPTLLWEFCSDATVCTAHSDANLGVTFGNPVITKRAYDGRWVVLVTSGYNNVASGDGAGHLYELDPFTGAILRQVSTGVGSTTTPSGLSKITAMVTNPDTDNTTHYVYGGDLQGDLFRFDLSGASIAVSTFATLKDAAGKPQSITTRPELGQVNGYPVVFVGTGRLLGASDMQNPATLTPAGNWSYVGSFYALYDNGTSLGNPRTNASMVVQTLSSFSSTQLASSMTAVNIPTNIGWMVDFPGTGERVNIDPQLVLGTLVVTTNIPTSDVCAAGGNSWLYQFDYSSGGAISGVANNIAGTEIVGALTVGNVVVQLPSQAVKIISTESSGSKLTSGLNTNAVNPIVRRVGWREFMQ